jgi:hypothetical protein
MSSGMPILVRMLEYDEAALDAQRLGGHCSADADTAWSAA